jgi:hypothetical protein
MSDKGTLQRVIEMGIFGVVLLHVSGLMAAGVAYLDGDAEGAISLLSGIARVDMYGGSAFIAAAYIVLIVWGARRIGLVERLKRGEPA